MSRHDKWKMWPENRRHFTRLIRPLPKTFSRKTFPYMSSFGRGQDVWCSMCGRPKGEVNLGRVNVKPYSMILLCESCWEVLCDWHEKVTVKTLIRRFVQDPHDETPSSSPQSGPNEESH